MKYYWLIYSYNNAGGGKTETEDVTTKHPFEYMNMIRGKNGRLVTYNIALLNWKEITKAEYQKFN